MEDDTQTSQTVDPAATDTSTQVNQSEAITQTNEGTPEATQQTEETVEIKAEDTVEDKLYAGKYKSVEDMEKAYRELQSKATKDSQEKAELARILNESFAAPEPQVQADPYAIEPDPINNEVENLKSQVAVQSFIMTHPNADASSMQEVFNTDPLVKQISGHEAKLEYAFLKSQSMSSSKAIAEARKTATQETKAKIVEKQTVQVESSKATEQIDEKSDLKNRMSSGSYEDREKARKEYIRKYLI